MAGKALRKRVFAEIEARGGAEYLQDYIAEGGTVLDLATELGCSRTYLSRHLNAHPEYKTALDDARRESADKLADEALQIADSLADDVEVTREQIAVAKERIDVRKWLATVNHPDRYQQNRNGPTVVLNINQLHLDALRKTRTGVTIDAAAIGGGDDA
jgi:AraC-like DNA-binding protein